jgi:hypothetical protein
MHERLHCEDQASKHQQLVRCTYSYPPHFIQYFVVKIPQDVPFRIRYQKLKNKIDLTLTPQGDELWHAKGHVTPNILDNLQLPVSVRRDDLTGDDAILLPCDRAAVAEAGHGKCNALADGRFYINLLRKEVEINQYFRSVFDPDLLRGKYGISDLEVGIKNGFRYIIERRLRPDLLPIYSQVWVEPKGA